VVFLGAGEGDDEWVGSFGVGCETLAVGLKEKWECSGNWCGIQYCGVLTRYIHRSIHLCAPHPSIFPMRIR
jgi:hypothetical protein